MAESLVFNRRQRLWVGEILGSAESLVGGYFQLDFGDLERFPYDLRTLAKLGENEKTGDALAQICKYEVRKKHDSGIPKKEFYRICLQDDKILNAVEAETPSLFRPLVLYILTHELIHVATFSLEPEKFYLAPDEKGAEETRVHRTTYDILKGIPDPCLEPLLDHYRPWREGAPRVHDMNY
ncbi:MAG TPA: hypothetical protein VLS90_18435 [Thermodesulfobacteriota bacterium]|nr:hypothetical protein [Thermodesulfobacteriota bacterium]